jgi:hypothetical protein
MNSKHLLPGAILALAYVACHANTADVPIEVLAVSAFNSRSPGYDAGDAVVSSKSQIAHSLACLHGQFILPAPYDPQRKGLRLLRFLQRHEVVGGRVTISDGSIKNGMCSILGVLVP